MYVTVGLPSRLRVGSLGLAEYHEQYQWFEDVVKPVSFSGQDKQH